MSPYLVLIDDAAYLEKVREILVTVIGNDEEVFGCVSAFAVSSDILRPETMLQHISIHDPLSLLVSRAWICFEGSSDFLALQHSIVSSTETTNPFIKPYVENERKSLTVRALRLEFMQYVVRAVIFHKGLGLKVS